MHVSSSRSTCFAASAVGLVALLLACDRETETRDARDAASGRPGCEGAEAIAELANRSRTCQGGDCVVVGHCSDPPFYAVNVAAERELTALIARFSGCFGAHGPIYEAFCDEGMCKLRETGRQCGELPVEAGVLEAAQDAQSVLLDARDTAASDTGSVRAADSR